MKLPTTVGRNLVWLTGGEMAIKGGLLLAGIVIARGGGPAAMGIFTVSFGAALVAAQLLAAGQPEVLIREAARRGPAALQALVCAAQRVQYRVAPFTVPFLLAGLVTLAWRSRELGWALLTFVPYALLRARLVVMTAVFKGRDRMEVEVGARGVELAVALALLGVAVWAEAPGWVSGLAFTAGAAVGVAGVTRLLRGEGEGGVAPAEEVLCREGLPFLGLAAATQLLVRVDSLLQAGVGVAAEQVGQYGVAHAAVWSLVAASQLSALAAYPSVSRACAGGRLRPWHALVLGATGVALGGGLAGALFTLRRPLVLAVFGPGYDEAAHLAGVLVWLLPGASASMLVGVVLAATRRQGWSLVCQGVLVVAVVLGNLLALPRWGVMGSAGVAVVAHNLAALVVIALGAVAAARPRVLAEGVGR